VKGDTSHTAFWSYNFVSTCFDSHRLRAIPDSIFAGYKHPAWTKNISYQTFHNIMINEQFHEENTSLLRSNMLFNRCLTVIGWLQSSSLFFRLGIIFVPSNILGLCWIQVGSSRNEKRVRMSSRLTWLVIPWQFQLLAIQIASDRYRIEIWRWLKAFTYITYLRWWFQIFVMFTPKIEEGSHFDILWLIFFRWVETTKSPSSYSWTSEKERIRLRTHHDSGAKIIYITFGVE